MYREKYEIFDMYKNICVNYTGFYTPFIEHNYDKNCLNIFLLTFTFLVLLVIFYRLYVRGDTPGVCIVRGRGGGRGKYTSSQCGHHCSAESWRKPSGGGGAMVVLA